MGNFGKNPVILIAALLFLLLFIVLPLINRKKTSNGFSSKDRGVRTLVAQSLVDKEEQAYKAAHGTYTSEIAALVLRNSELRDDLALTPVVIQALSGTPSGYFVQLTSDIVSLAATRQGGKMTLNCVIIKSTDGVDCPNGSITSTGTVVSTTPTPTTTTTTTG